ncbi:NaeI family type II restriction endonuclease [Streptomyces sp. NPDC014656]|uniref:NaeI family type II restriction endonuclease n=1 Tax=Streptomyces sp. NPDC014656 TaxID=3364878 RepID=UPI0036F55E5E
MGEQSDVAYCETSDSALQEVLDWFAVQRGHESRFRESLRTAVDEVLDGRRTGRFSIDSLRKTEKTYLGTKVEIVLQDAFEIPQGPKKGMDYLIRGHQVDCKFTSQATWEIPTEAVGQLCLLVRVNEKKEYFSAGILRARSEFLTGSTNKDGKRSVSAAGKKRIQWLHEVSAFPKSLLLSLPASQVRHIFGEGASGQERVNRFFRLVQNRIVDGESIDTVAQQRDGMARLREGKGRSRTVLRSEGILIATHWKTHHKVLAQLGVPLPRMPRNGEAVAFRVAEAAEHHGGRPRVKLDGKEWVLADEFDPPQPGPYLPDRSSDSS